MMEDTIVCDAVSLSDMVVEQARFFVETIILYNCVYFGGCWGWEGLYAQVLREEFCRYWRLYFRAKREGNTALVCVELSGTGELQGSRLR